MQIDGVTIEQVDIIRVLQADRIFAAAVRMAALERERDALRKEVEDAKTTGLKAKTKAEKEVTAGG